MKLTDSQRGDLIENLIDDMIATVMFWATKNDYSSLYDFVSQAMDLDRLSDCDLVDYYVSQIGDKHNG
jgi:hypothetical protein